jgi:tRNA threonylcarbamoyladenosine biosynthesis protein TsaB
MAAVDRVLKDTGLRIADIDGFAIAIGPGSLTRPRIGFATINGLALSTNKPLAAVPVL